MTEIAPHIVTSPHLRHLMHQEFGVFGGGKRLAMALGISTTTASNLVLGRSERLDRLAAYFGFIRGDHEDEWVKSTAPVSPLDLPRQIRWTAEVVQELRDEMAKPKRQRLRTTTIARRFGVGHPALRGIMHRQRIRARNPQGNPSDQVYPRRSGSLSRHGGA